MVFKPPSLWYFVIAACAKMETLANSKKRVHLDFPGGAVVKNLLANAGDAGDQGVIPGLGGSPGGGMDRGAWWATVLEWRRVRHD